MVPKFRAWLKDEKEMQNVLAFDTRGHSFLGIEGTHVTVGGWCDNFEVGKQAVLMQSTGLKDKNGVEIFEGDSVKPERGEPFIVKHFVKGQGVIKHVDISTSGHLFEGIYSGDELEILGNIYENPELLEPTNE